MDKQAELNKRINAVIGEYADDCEGRLDIETVLAALDDAKTDASAILGVPSDAEMKRMRALYEGEKRAGLLQSEEEYRRSMVDAGRGHLLK